MTITVLCFYFTAIHFNKIFNAFIHCLSMFELFLDTTLVLLMTCYWLEIITAKCCNSSVHEVRFNHPNAPHFLLPFNVCIRMYSSCHSGCHPYRTSRYLLSRSLAFSVLNNEHASPLFKICLVNLVIQHRKTPIPLLSSSFPLLCRPSGASFRSHTDKKKKE